MAPPLRRLLGEILVQDYHVLDVDVREALDAQAQGIPDRIGQFLVRRGILSDRDLATALGQQLRIPVMIGLPRLTVSEDVLARVPPSCAEKKLVIPVAITGGEEDPRLVLAMADPTDRSAVEALERLTGCTVQPAIATEEDIRRAFKIFYLGEVGHADPAELTDSFEVLRTRLRTSGGGTNTSASFSLSLDAPRAPKAQHSGELFKPVPLSISALEDDSPIPMPDVSESLEIEHTRPGAGVLPQDPDDVRGSTVGA